MLAVRDLEQCSKMYLWVLVGMVVYINTLAARFGPLTWDCLAASGLERSLQRSHRLDRFSPQTWGMWIPCTGDQTPHEREGGWELSITQQRL